MIGRTLAHYEILDKLGEGGMGEVYLAMDRRLDRKVALKVLPAALARDPRLLGRFEREAKTVAALNHPSIVTIHSVEEADGVHFLTMELVEGQSLDRRIPADGMSIAGFLDLAPPLAEAVASAHETGVTHRDLKPANVMVTTDGRLKVLDFGLAKLRERPGEATGIDAPTEALTRDGLVVGTVPYMSPEQVQGKPIDSRSDVFSLGILFYEMLTGRRPFGGGNSAETISALLRDAPVPVAELNNEVPGQLARVVHRCLEKDPSRRYQSARDLALELDDLRRRLASSSAVGATPAGATPRARRFLPSLLGLIALALVAIVAVREWQRSRADDSGRPPAEAPLRLTKLTGAPGLEDDPAWSPDGRFLAYTTDERGNLDVVVQPVGGGELIWAFATDADEAQPTWSPDGRQMAFVSARDRGGRLTTGIRLGPLTGYILAGGGDLFVAPAFGGALQKLASDAYGPAWSPDGSSIAFVAPGEVGLDVWLVSVGSGERTRLTSGARQSFQPAWSPDGTWLAYGSADPTVGVYDLHVVAPSGRAPLSMGLPPGVQAMRPTWSPDGRWIYFSSNLAGRFNLWRAGAPEQGSKTFGEPHQITFGGGSDVSVTVAASGGALAFSTVNIDVNLWEHDLATGEVRRITRETGYEGNAQASPDGETLLLTTDRGGRPELWTYSLDGDPLSRVGETISVDFTGGWSPDGRSVAYARPTNDGLSNLVYKELGSLQETLLLERSFSFEWSPHGREIAVAEIKEGSGHTDLWVVRLDGGPPRRLTSTEGTINNFPTWSPDGSEIIFNSEESGLRKLWRVPSGGGEPRPITFGDSEDSHPRWSPVDPEAVLFLRNHQKLCILNPVSGDIRELEVELGSHFGLDYPSWSADGSRIYFSLAEKTGDIFIAEQ